MQNGSSVEDKGNTQEGAAVTIITNYMENLEFAAATREASCRCGQMKEDNITDIVWSFPFTNWLHTEVHYPNNVRLQDRGSKRHFAIILEKTKQEISPRIK